jgi:hypothetical protein
LTKSLKPPQEEPFLSDVWLSNGGGEESKVGDV